MATDKVEQIIEEWLRQRAEGVRVTSDQLLQQHPEHFERLMAFVLDYFAPERDTVRADAAARDYEAHSRGWHTNPRVGRGGN